MPCFCTDEHLGPLQPPFQVRIWSILALFSGIVASAVVEQADNRYNLTQDEKINISLASISLCFAIIAIMIYSTPNCAKVRGSVLEYLMIFVVLGTWCSSIGTMNTRGDVTQVAHLPDGTKVAYIRNANLYYFSWGCFFCSVVLLATIVQNSLDIDIDQAPKTLATRFVLWSVLVSLLTIVMGEASAMHQEANCTKNDTYLCLNTNIAVGMSTASCIISLLILLVKIIRRGTHMFRSMETLCAVTITSGFIITLIYTTGSDGPGTEIGNLYYATWLTLGVSFSLTFFALREIAPVGEIAEKEQAKDE